MFGIATAADAPAEARRATILTESGDLAALVVDFESAFPGRASGGYDVPTSSERTSMASAWDRIEAGDLQRAASIAASLSYDVVRFTDTDTGRVSILLRERRNANGSWPHGWGLYVRTRSATSPLVVEAPHPRADVHSERMAVTTFRKANAAALLIAGAHRDANSDGSADVAHRRDSVFEAVHRATVTSGSRVYSVHGFADASMPGVETVISSGAPPTTLTRRTGAALSARGFVVCLYGGTNCAGLAGTTNVQGESARAAGAEFIHAEVNRSVRDDTVRRAAYTNAVISALS